MASSTSEIAESLTMEVYDLCEVTRFNDLPKTVAVMSGSYVTSDTRIAQGDILLLRSDFPKFLSLNVHDAVSKKDIVVSSDCQVKFNVLPPKDYNSESEGQIKAMYPTVNDLLRDCPTYFQATVNFDEPYLSRNSVKAGERFRFGRIIHSPNKGQVRLECIDSSDNIHRLAGDCRGHFEPLADDISYTLRELVNMARVSRRLKISAENTKLKLIASDKSEICLSDDYKCNDTNTTKEMNREGKISEQDTTKLSPLPVLPLTFKGVMKLNIPNRTLEVSPWNDLDVRWYIPNDSRLLVRMYSPDDYEIPVQSKQKHPFMNLYEFVSRHDTFPVEATLIGCNDIPREFVPYLRNVSDVILHKKNLLTCLIVKSLKNEHFIVTPNVHVTFVDSPRSYGFVFELCECSVGTQIRIMEHIASDFPSPYSLRCGDVIKLTDNKPRTLKMKKGPVPEYKILCCEKLNADGEFVKLTLPIDLEVHMFELIDMSAQKLYKLPDILSGKQKLATGPVSVMEEDKMSRLPLPPVVQMVTIIHDEVVLVSPFKRTESGTIEQAVKTCLAIPIRHSLLLSFSKRLELPSNYFVIPRAKHRKTILVEHISQQTAKELERKKHTTSSYEDIPLIADTPVTMLSSSKSNEPLGERRKNRIHRSFRRISRIFNNTFNSKSIQRVPSSIPSSDLRAQDNIYTDADDVSANSYQEDEENHYEFIDIHANSKRK